MQKGALKNKTFKAPFLLQPSLQDLKSFSKKSFCSLHFLSLSNKHFVFYPKLLRRFFIYKNIIEKKISKKYNLNKL